MSDLIGKLGRDLVEEKEGKLSQNHSNVPGITTQYQLNELTCIQTNLGYQISDLIGKLGCKLVEEKDNSYPQVKPRPSFGNTTLLHFKQLNFKQTRSNVSELLNNLVIVVVRNDSLYNMVVWNDLFKPIWMRSNVSEPSNVVLILM